MRNCETEELLIDDVAQLNVNSTTWCNWCEGNFIQIKSMFTMVSKVALFQFLLVLSDVIYKVFATTHWVVTENGKIQPQVDTVFEMRQSHDLLTFLNQEKLRETASAIHNNMLMRLARLENQLADLDPAIDFMHRLYSTDSDCLQAGKPMEDDYLYDRLPLVDSILDQLEQAEYVLEEIPQDCKKRVPDCKKTFPLDFSMYTFEHLSAMQNRKNLTQRHGTRLLEYLPVGFNLDTLGHQLAQVFQHNKTTWVHFNLAAMYWMIKGNAYDALECTRRAIVSAPRQYRHIPLLMTGAILHASSHSGEAAIVLHMAIDYNPTLPFLHLALGNIYVVLGDYEKAIPCYENSLRLSPSYNEAKVAKHGALCYLKIESCLTLLQRHLHDTLTELHIFHTEQKELLEVSSLMLTEQATSSPVPEIRSSTTVKSDVPRTSQSHHQRFDDDSAPFQAMSDYRRVAESIRFEIDMTLEMLKTIEVYINGIDSEIMKYKSLQDTSL